MFLLDTNILSDTIARRPNEGVRRWLADNETAELYVSAITIGELHKGVAMAQVRNHARAARLAQWVTVIELRFAERILPIDRVIAQRWGVLMADNPSANTEDRLIAATALTLGLAIVTRNVRDFASTGVAVIDPFD